MCDMQGKRSFNSMGHVTSWSRRSASSESRKEEEKEDDKDEEERIRKGRRQKKRGKNTHMKNIRTRATHHAHTQ